METPNPKYKLALWFSVKGDTRFLSHRDTMTFWQRALARAQLPVKHSQGFNPRMRLSLPLPRSVGMSCEADLLLFELTEHTPEQQIHQALSDQMPAGIDIVNIQTVPRHLSLLPQWAQYRLTLGPAVNRDDLKQRLRAFLQCQEHFINRPARPGHPARTIDLRAAVTQLELVGDGLICALAIGPQATPRVTELIASLALDGDRMIREIRRLATGYPEIAPDAPAPRATPWNLLEHGDNHKKN